MLDMNTTPTRLVTICMDITATNISLKPLWTMQLTPTTAPM